MSSIHASHGVVRPFEERCVHLRKLDVLIKCLFKSASTCIEPNNPMVECPESPGETSGPRVEARVRFVDLVCNLNASVFAFSWAE